MSLLSTVRSFIQGSSDAKRSGDGRSRSSERADDDTGAPDVDGKAIDKATIGTVGGASAYAGLAGFGRAEDAGGGIAATDEEGGAARSAFRSPGGETPDHGGLVRPDDASPLGGMGPGSPGPSPAGHVDSADIGGEPGDAPIGLLDGIMGEPGVEPGPDLIIPRMAASAEEVSLTSPDTPSRDDTATETPPEEPAEEPGEETGGEDPGPVVTHPPAPPALEPRPVDETSPAGTVVIRLTPGGSTEGPVTYELTDSAGRPLADGDFEVVGDEIRVKADADLDYETAPTREIHVTITDANGTSTPGCATITIADAAEDIQLSDGGVSFTDTGVAELSVTGGSGDDAITGHASGGSILEGGAGADTIAAGSGNDVLTGGSGDDVLTGGAGSDTAVYSGARKDYRITEADGVYTVVDTRPGSPDGTDTVSEVESFTFADGTISVDDLLNAAPTDLALSAATVAENDAGAVIGTLSAEDADWDTVGFTVDDVRFEVTPDGALKLKDGVSLDYERGATVDVTVTATDSQGATAQKVFTLKVGDEAEHVQLSDGGVSFTDTGVAELSVTGGSGDDAITGHASGGSILDGGAGADTIAAGSGDDVLTGGAGDDVLTGGAGSDTAVYSGERKDYRITEADGVYTVVDTRPGSPDGTDTVSEVESFTFADGTIAVDDLLNAAPTDLALSAATVAENDAGAVIGTLSAEDADWDTVGFTVDDARFEVTADGALKLKDGVSLDYERGATVDVTVTATDSQGATAQKVFTLKVGDEAEHVQLSDGGVSFTDTGVAELSVTGGSGDDAITGHASGGSILDGGAGADTIAAGSGNDVLTGGAGDDVLTGGSGSDTAVYSGERKDYRITEADGVYTVVDTRPGSPDGTDTVSEVESFTFADGTIAVDDLLNAAPTDLALSAATVAENDAGAVIGTLSAEDADWDTVGFTVDDVRFEVTADGSLKLKDGVSLDYERGATVDVTVTATDSQGATAQKVFTLKVGDEAEHLQLSDGGVSFTDTGVAELSVTGGSGDDAITGHASGGSILDGGAGADTIAAGSGDDVLTGGSGDDVLTGGAGSDTAVYSGERKDYRITEADGVYTVVDTRPGSPDGTDTVSEVESFTFADGTISVDDLLNAAPTELALSAATVAENDAGAVIGTLSAEDADWDTVGFTVDDVRFEVTPDGSLKLKDGVSLDYERGATVDVTVTATDSQGATAQKVFTLKVGDEAEHLQLSDGGVSFADRGVAELSITGGDGSDTITAHEDGGVIDGGAGNDRIIGRGGDDTLMGGDGEDSLLGGGGDDVIHTGKGSDTVDGGEGSDIVYLHSRDFGRSNTVTDSGTGAGDVDTLKFVPGDYNPYRIQGSFSSGSGIEVIDGSAVLHDILTTGDLIADFDFTGITLIGVDSIQGKSDNDTITGSAGDDCIEGKAGNDSLAGAGGADTLLGGFGDDVMSGGAGNDILDGGAGHDLLRGGTGSDYMDGGTGRDTFVIEDDFGSDIIVGGADCDTIDASRVNDPLTVTLTGDGAGAITCGSDTISFSQIERLILSDLADVVDASGDTAGIEIVAGGGNDTITGGSGADTIAGGDGADLLAGGAANDAIDGGAGDDVAVFSGNRADYDITESDGVYTVALRPGVSSGAVDGTDTVRNVESFRFADGTLTVDELLNEAPADIALSAASVAENDAGAVIGKLSVQDAAWDKATLSVDDNRFEIGADGTLKLKPGISLDYETDGATVPLQVTATDAEGASRVETFKISVGDVAENIDLTGSGVSFTDTGVAELSVMGTGGADTITGEADGATEFGGGRGDDTILAGGGADTLEGGYGDDSLAGGAGDDLIEGSEGDDAIDGGAGSDVAVFNGKRSDYTVTESGGVYTVVDTRTDDVDGTDTVRNVESFRFTDVTLSADEVLNSGPENLALASATLMENDAGAVIGKLSAEDSAWDSVRFTVDDTRFEVKPDGTLKLRDGVSLDYESGTSLALKVTATDGQGATAEKSFTLTVGDEAEHIQLADGGVAFTDTGVAELSITGGSGADTITAHEDGGVVDGGLGDDRITGGGAADTLKGGAGNDSILGGGGDDVIETGAGTDTVDGGAGSDTVHLGSQGPGEANVLTDSGTGAGEIDTVMLVAGDHVPYRIQGDFSAGSGIEVIDGSAVWQPVLMTGDSSVTNFDFTGVTLRGIHEIRGLAKDDTIRGSDGDDFISGMAGNDVLAGGKGDDTLVGGAGDDTIHGGAGSDTILGGEGSDTIHLESQENGGGAVVTDDGAAGTDRIILSGENGTYRIQGTFSRDASGIEVIDASGDGGAVLGTNAAVMDWDLRGIDMRSVEKIEGTAGDDVVLGSASGDFIAGGAGDDTLGGGGGDDTLEGGAGSDTFLVTGGFGSDAISGGTNAGGKDTVYMSGLGQAVTATYTGNGAGTITDGDDTLGFSGIERLILTENGDVVDASATDEGVTILGLGGDDTLTGGDCDDTLDGGAGADVIRGGIGNDLMLGMDGDDILTGGGGKDVIRGGDGNDTIAGGAGADRLRGDAGDDTFLIEDGFGADTITGDEGRDTIDLSGMSNAVTVILTGDGTGVITDGAETLNFSGIERLILSDGADVVDTSADSAGIEIIGGGGNDSISGGSGDDTIDGGAGNDMINGGAGHDILAGGAGNDIIHAHGGNDRIDGGDGTDTLFGSDGNDTILGGAGGDLLQGEAGTDSLSGGDGNDSIEAGAGNDTIDGGAGRDSLAGGLGDDLIRGGADDDGIWVDNRGGTDTIHGGDGRDVLGLGSAAGDTSGVQVTFTGSHDGSYGYDAGGTSGTFTGIEEIATTHNDDVITDADGNFARHIAAGGGNDTVDAGRGGDTVEGGAGDDLIRYVDGGTIDAGSGDDRVEKRSGVFTGDDDAVIGGGAGTDTFAIAGRSGDGFNATFTVDLAAGTIFQQGYGAHGTLTGFENIDIVDAAVGARGDDGANRITASGDFANELDGGGGNDTIDGGAGNDTIHGGSGDDVIAGGTGDDVIHYGEGADLVTGGEGDDRIDDVIGANRTSGSATVSGGTGNDTIYGSAGGDLLSGDEGNDQISGEAGADTISGGAGSDTLIGGAGADTFLVEDGFGGDKIYGGYGADATGDRDTIDLSALTAPVTATFTDDESGVIGDGTHSLGFWDIERLVLTEQADTVDMTMNGSDVEIVAGGGRDEIKVADRGGDVTVDGGADWDVLELYNSATASGTRIEFTGAGKGTYAYLDGSASGVFSGIEHVNAFDHDDTIIDAAGDYSHYMTGGDGNDTIDAGRGADTVVGGSGDDLIRYAEGEDIRAESGDDRVEKYLGVSSEDDNATVSGGAGNDTFAISGQAGDGFSDAYTVDLSAGTIQERGHGGRGTLTGFENVDIVNAAVGAKGDDGANRLTASGNFANRLEGGAGDDTLSGGGGNDTLLGGSGADRLSGGTGNDRIDGGAGADVFVVEDGFGSDTLIGGADRDTIDLSAMSSGVTVTFTGDHAGTITSGANRITFSGVERLILSEHADVVDAGCDTAGVEILGAAGDDRIRGGSGADTLHSGEGADTLDGGGGSDRIILDRMDYGGSNFIADSGSSGTDTLVLSGQDGTYRVQGAFSKAISGIEIIDGTADSNALLGSNASWMNWDLSGMQLVDVEKIQGTGNHDIITGSAGGDRILGDRGDDRLSGQLGNDTLEGGLGHDTLDGGDGNDSLLGGAGNDVISTGRGADTVDGGAGSDTIYLADRDYAQSNHVSDSGTDGGFDTVILVGAADTYRVQGNFSAADGIERIDGTNLTGEMLGTRDAAANFDFTGIDLVGVDKIIGTGGNDKIRGSAGSDVIEGDGGHDRLFGEGGSDRLDGGSGQDLLWGGAGNDTMVGGTGNDTMSGGDGADQFWIRAGHGSDQIDGGAGAGSSSSGWMDAIRMMGGGDASTSYGADRIEGEGWTLVLDGDHVTASGSDYAIFNDNAAGTITFDGGETVTFHGIEQINW